MKKLISMMPRNLFIAALAVFASAKTIAQNTLYTNNWNDQSSFTTSCGLIISNAWEVHNDSCEFTSSAFRLPKFQTGFDMEINVNRVGKMTAADKVYCFVYVDDIISSTFVIKGMAVAEQLRRVEHVKAYSEANVYIRLCFVSSANDKSWILKSGDLSASLPASSNNPVSANYNGRVIQLKWNCSTTDESNYFIVERSGNNQVFEQVGLVKATENNLFSIIDHEIKPGTNFYRVKLKTFKNKLLAVGNTISVNADGEMTGQVLK